MSQYKAERTETIHLSVGESADIESLREPVVPPNLMLMPFWELPDIVEMVEEHSLDEDGVHGDRIVLSAKDSGTAYLLVGFRDMMTDKVIRQKRITIAVAEPADAGRDTNAEA